MGETTYLMQPFSFTSGISHKPKEATPVYELGQSISLGRFMSESLAWEKWSIFSHNKYVEEAEKFTRPGSVAQMKAFFEAHYRNLAPKKTAKAANAAAANYNNNTTLQAEKNEGEVLEGSATVDDIDGQQIGIEEKGPEAIIVLDDNECKKSYGDMGNVEHMEVEELSQNGAVADGGVEVHALNCSRQMEKPLLKGYISNGDDDDRVSICKKRSAASMSKPLITIRTTKVLPSPARATASLRARKESSTTPISKKTTRDWLDKRGLIPKPTHKSVNHNLVRETNQRTSSISCRFGSSRAISNTLTSKSCSTIPRTATKACKQLDHRKTSATLRTENTSCSKLRSSSRDKTQSTIFTLPFSFRTEERAAKRKEKLEEKFNVERAKKAQQQETLKDKAETETELKKLRQRHCFKARPLPAFYKERGSSKDNMEKVVMTHPQPPRRKPAPSIRTTQPM